MSSIINKAKEALKKPEGMSGTGADQTALNEDPDAFNQGYEEKYGKPKDNFKQPDVPSSMSGMGVDQGALTDDGGTHLSEYESKYGKPNEETVKKVESGHMGENKSTVGPDQEAAFSQQKVDEL